MKAAWRIRKLGSLQRAQKRPLVPLRFASTAAATAAPSIPVATSSQQHIREHASHTYEPNQAGPSNYATRSPPPTEPSPEDEDNFFTSHRPPLTQLQDHLASYSESDARILTDLQKHIYQAYIRRDDEFAGITWRMYGQLSPSARASLNHHFLQNVLRAVVPSFDQLDTQGRRRVVMHQEGNVQEPHKGISKYGRRMSQMLRDIELSNNEEDGAGPRASDYRFALAIMGRVGDTYGAEAISDGMRTKGHTMDIRMVDSRLAALREWLDRTAPGSLHGSRAQRVLEALWQIQGDMSTFDLVPRNVSTSLLIQTIYAAKGHIGSADIVANLDVILEEVCVKAYGVDMRYLTLGEKGERLRGPHVYALVDYWGRKGDVWKMLSAYEVLTEQPGATIELGEGTEEVNEEIPTLSGMMRQEADEARGMTIFGRRRSTDVDVVVAREAQEQGRDPPPHMTFPPSPLPLPPLTDKPTFKDFYPQSTPRSITFSSKPILAYPNNRIHTETIAILVRHVIAAGDMQLLNHVLASALSSTTAIRAEWLAALQFRQSATGGDFAHAEWFAVPGPRLAVDSQWFWDADLFARKSNASSWSRRRFQVLVSEAREQLEREKLVLLALRPGSQESIRPMTFDPSVHLEMIDVTEKKLDVVLEQTKESLLTKMGRVAKKYARSAKRLERKEAIEREKRERLAEKKRGRGLAAGMRTLSESSGTTQENGRVEASGGDTIVKMSSGWGGEGAAGVRMIGIA